VKNLVALVKDVTGHFGKPILESLELVDLLMFLAAGF
jgi:hypothetical protein